MYSLEYWRLFAGTHYPLDVFGGAIIAYIVYEAIQWPKIFNIIARSILKLWGSDFIEITRNMRNRKNTGKIHARVLSLFWLSCLTGIFGVCLISLNSYYYITPIFLRYVFIPYRYGCRGYIGQCFSSGLVDNLIIGVLNRMGSDRLRLRWRK